MSRRPLLSASLAWLAGILILASGCMDQSPTAALLEPTTVSAVKGAEAGGSGLQNTPLTAAHPFAPGSFTETITPRGGEIDFGIGTITFHAGSVDRGVRITAAVDGENMLVDFSPHMTFDVEPTLCFDVSGMSLPDNLAMIHITDDGVEHSLAYNFVGGQVCAGVTGFSKFILASE